MDVSAVYGVVTIKNYFYIKISLRFKTCLNLTGNGRQKESQRSEESGFLSDRLLPIPVFLGVGITFVHEASILDKRYVLQRSEMGAVGIKRKAAPMERSPLQSDAQNLVEMQLDASFS